MDKILASKGKATANATALWLVEQHVSKAPFQAMPASLQLSSADQAVAVQNEFVQLKAKQCGKPVGWKIALATPVMQKLVGLAAPVAGRLHKKQVVLAPAKVTGNRYGRLIVEFEIAMQIGTDLLPTSERHTGQSVAKSIRAVTCGFEVADDRQADYTKLGQQGLQLLADNAWNEGAVLGAWRDLKESYGEVAATHHADDVLGSLKGEAFINGVSVGYGYGRDLMGHPLNALAWLANEANDRGSFLKAGDITMLGSLVASKFPVKGDQLLFKLDGFEPISLTVR